MGDIMSSRQLTFSGMGGPTKSGPGQQNNTDTSGTDKLLTSSRRSKGRSGTKQPPVLEKNVTNNDRKMPDDSRLTTEASILMLRILTFWVSVLGLSWAEADKIMSDWIWSCPSPFLILD